MIINGFINGFIDIRGGASKDYLIQLIKHIGLDNYVILRMYIQSKVPAKFMCGRIVANSAAVRGTICGGLRAF
jgi:hypothetical protein